MRWLPRSLSTRLLLASITPALLFLVAVAVVLFPLLNLYQSQEQKAASQEIMSRAHDIKANVALLAATKRLHHLLLQQEFKDKFNQLNSTLQDDLKLLSELLVNKPQQSLLDETKEFIRQWNQGADQDFILFAQQPPHKEAQEHLTMMIRLGEKIQENISKMILVESQQLSKSQTISQEAVRTSVRAGVIALSLAILLSLVIPLYFSHSMTRSLSQFEKAMDDLRKGVFKTLPITGPSELAALARYFNMLGLASAERTKMVAAEQRRYQGIVGSMTNLLWSMDKETNLRDDFSSWVDYTGLKQHGCHSEEWINAVHPDEQEEVRAAWRKAINNRAMFKKECRLKHHDGNYRYFSTRCIPIFEGEDVSEWMCACTDITDRKKQDMLQKEKDAAEAANQAKSQFLARMSHELRTPLNAIIGMSKMLETQRFGPLNDKQQDYLTDVIQAGEHLLELINDVLDISRVEAGQLQVQFETVPLEEIIDGVLSTLESLIEKKQHDFRYTPPTVDGELETDSGRFKQILINLLANAVKFTPEQGKITFTVNWVREVDSQANSCDFTEASGVRMDVQDNGPGIPLEEQEQIWQEFQQADSRDKTIEGTGLGLSLTRKLVTLLGGIIWVKSEPNQGSCFSVVLPIHPPKVLKPVDPIASFDESQQEDATNRPLVLLMEDHESTNKLMADWLVDAGFRTVSAFTGEEGLEEARRLRPKLILLDLKLPKMDGRQILDELKTDPVTVDIPVIIVSVQEQSSNDLDIVDWVVKPVDREELLSRIQLHCPELFDKD